MKAKVGGTLAAAGGGGGNADDVLTNTATGGNGGELLPNTVADGVSANRADIGNADDVLENTATSDNAGELLTTAASGDYAGEVSANTATGSKLGELAANIIAKVELSDNERLDDLQYRGRLIIQSKAAFAFSMDSVLLAHFASTNPKWRMLDLGTGGGVMPLLMADKLAHIEAVELNPVMVDLATRNVRLNQLDAKITVRQQDYRKLAECYPAGSFDLVIANPPYRSLGQGNLSNGEDIRAARHEVTATLADVIAAAKYALKFRGRFALVHMPERLAEIMDELTQHNLTPKKMVFIQPKADKMPNIVLIESICGGKKGGLKVLPTIVAHKANGEYTDYLKAIYHGAAIG